MEMPNIQVRPSNIGWFIEKWKLNGDAKYADSFVNQWKMNGDAKYTGSFIEKWKANGHAKCTGP